MGNEIPAYCSLGEEFIAQGLLFRFYAVHILNESTGLHHIWNYNAL